MKRIFLISIILFLLSASIKSQEQFCRFDNEPNQFILASNGVSSPFVVDSADFKGVTRAVSHLQKDIYSVTQTSPNLLINNFANNKSLVIVGTLGKSSYINNLIKSSKIKSSDIVGKREKFIIQTIANPFPNVDEALVIAGSDMRGTIYGIYELSRQIGVSPWYYWADVPVQKHQNIYIKNGIYTAGEPAVRYRGIFLNDEAPALSGWSKETFGGFNHQFYEKVFELILRLRGNFIWPAMWGNAFYDDDPENGKLASEMGIVVGTSHHEPMNLAQQDWKRRGKGAWDYASNADELNKFWQSGIERAKNYETITTIGMRGDGDKPMSEESNIKLLEDIIKKQREIIQTTTKKKANEIPQVWALYKEVQDYYDKGMRVPDDVTLLLCDDNWGNVRKLPSVDAPKRKGGYGLYYHFDYVGGPRNYKWLNVSQVQRIWEQLDLTYSHGVDRIWIVNVGDLKPMEYPISFFMDMAWNPKQFTTDNLLNHTEKWCADQFGQKYAKESARIIDTYTKFNRRVTPELLNDTTYSLENYNEFEKVTSDYTKLALDAFRLFQTIPNESKDAFEQLVLFPADACSNLYEMYFAVAKNKQLAKKNNPEANIWADKVKTCFLRDSLLTIHYNTEIAGGKWNHMMDQIRIGYTYWQQPRHAVMPQVKYIASDINQKKFTESNGYISIEAAHYNKAVGNSQIEWKIIPNLGKTLSGITTFPQNIYPKPEDKIYLEYNIETTSIGEFPIHILVSPTLNFNQNKGLRYALSVDGGEEQIVNINEKYNMRQMEKWQANSINETITKHLFTNTGTHTIRFRVLEPGIVLQKMMIDMGGLKKSYLGAPENN